MMFFSWEPVGVKDSRTRSGLTAPDEDQEALLESDEEPDGAELGDEYTDTDLTSVAKYSEPNIARIFLKNRKLLHKGPKKVAILRF